MHSKQIPSLDVHQARVILSDNDVNLLTVPCGSYQHIADKLNLKNMQEYQFWLVNQPWTENQEALDASLVESFGASVSSDLYAQLSEMMFFFISVTGDAAPFFSLRIVDDEYIKSNGNSVSSQFHRDGSVLTLQYTIAGDTLEWTDNDNVRREFFGSTQIQPCDVDDKKILRDRNRVQKVPSGVIAILKGEMRKEEKDKNLLDFLDEVGVKSWDDFNVGKGLIHRGPKEARGKRLVLTVSTHKVPNWMPK